MITRIYGQQPVSGKVPFPRYAPLPLAVTNVNQNTLMTSHIIRDSKPGIEKTIQIKPYILLIEDINTDSHDIKESQSDIV